MRWLFVDENDRKGTKTKDDVILRIEAWWSEFAENATRISAGFKAGGSFDVADWTVPRLEAVHPQLMWEYGPPVNGEGHRLVITCETERHLRPLTEEVVARAPEIKGWEFYSYRLADPIGQALATTTGRSGLRPDEDCRVTVSRGDHNRVDLSFRWSEEQAQDKERTNAAFIAAESILGEERLDHWIGAIDEAVELDTGGTTLPLSELRATVEAEISAIRRTLPTEPHSSWVETASWTRLESSPKQQEDYARWYDLAIPVTANLDLWRASHEGDLFFSGRYSRVGECFVYVKLDRLDWPDGGSDRGEVESGIDEALRASNLGVSFGGGTGLRYSYIDLALTNLKEGVEATAQALRTQGVGKRSWILFFDADLVGEWVGVYPDTPRPFGFD